MFTHKVDIFPSLVYVVTGVLNETQRKDIISYARTLDDRSHGCIPENGISNHDINYSFLDGVADNVLSCKFIKEQILERVNSYCDDIGYTHCRLSNSWINFQYKDSVLMKHTHPESRVSGALYLNADDQSSKIYFYNPNPYIYFSSVTTRNEYNYEYKWFKPVSGDMILFPSWLSHGSNGEKNQTEERVVISFNTTGR